MNTHTLDILHNSTHSSQSCFASARISTRIAPSTCTRLTPHKLPSHYANVWPRRVSATRGFLPRYLAFMLLQVTVHPRWPSSTAAASPKCKVPLIASCPSVTCKNKTKLINTHFICERAALRRSAHLLRSDSKNNTSLLRCSTALENPERRTDRSAPKRPTAPRPVVPLLGPRCLDRS